MKTHASTYTCASYRHNVYRESFCVWAFGGGWSPTVGNASGNLILETKGRIRRDPRDSENRGNVLFIYMSWGAIPTGAVWKRVVGPWTDIPLREKGPFVEDGLKKKTSVFRRAQSIYWYYKKKKKKCLNISRVLKM